MSTAPARRPDRRARFAAARRSRPSHRVLGVLAVTAAVVMWGVISVLVKAIDGIGGVGIATFRLWMAAAILVGALTARGRRLDRALLIACLPGGAWFAADLIFYFVALKETSVANASMIGALQPVFLLPLAGRLFDERTSAAVVAFSLVAVSGTVVVVLGGSGVPEWSATGDLLALGATIAWTAYFVVSKRARSHLGALEWFAGVTVVAGLLVLPFALVTGADLSPAGPGAWVQIAIVAFTSGAVGHLLLNWAFPYVPIQLTSLLTLVTPVVAVIGAVAFLDESVNGVQIGGIAVVLLSLGEVVRRQSAEPTEPIAAASPATVAYEE